MYHHTISTTLLYGLREAFAILTEEGLENTIERHRRCARRLYEGLARLDLELFVRDPSKRLPTVTTIALPRDVSWQEVVGYAMKKSGSFRSLEFG